MTSSKYLVSIVNDILDMNKLESGGVVEQEIPFNLAELLNRVNLGKQKQAAEKNVEYIVDWEQSDIRHMDLAGNPIYVERPDRAAVCVSGVQKNMRTRSG